MGRAGRPSNQTSDLRDTPVAALSDVVVVAAMEDPQQFAPPLDSSVQPLLDSLNRDPQLSDTIHYTGMTEYELGQYANAWLDGLHSKEGDTVILQPTHKSHRAFVEMAIDVAEARGINIEVWWPDDQNESEWIRRFETVEREGQNLIFSSLAQPLGDMGAPHDIVQKVNKGELPYYGRSKAYSKSRWNVLMLPDPDWAAALGNDTRTGFAHHPSALRQLANDLQSFMHNDTAGGLPAHIETLKQRAARLNELKDDIEEIHLEGPGTSLRMKLTPATQWATVDHPLQVGSDEYTLANSATDEVFATPLAGSVCGKFMTTLPLHLEGTGRVVERLKGEFNKNGELVKLQALRQNETSGEWEEDPLGQKALEMYFEKKEGEPWPQCGEVGLLDSSGRIAQTGRNYLSTFLDEHGGFHIALGDSYEALGGGETNKASVHKHHLDITLGDATSSVHVTLRSTGEKMALILKGLWQDF